MKSLSYKRKWQKSAEWKRLRAHVIVRDRYRCAKCGYIGSARFLEVDHIVPPRKGGPLRALHNLRTLCKPCHADKTRKENTGPSGRRRRRIPKKTSWTLFRDELDL